MTISWQSQLSPRPGPRAKAAEHAGPALASSFSACPIPLRNLPLPDTSCCCYRPFVWKDQIFLGHWVGYLPAHERMAISVLNLEKGRTELVHRFSSLSREIEDSGRPESLLPKSSQSLPRSLLAAKPKARVQPVFRCRILHACEILGHQPVYLPPACASGKHLMCIISACFHYGAY